MKILADASLLGLEKYLLFPFEISYYQSSNLAELLPLADILVCRSTLKVDRALLAKTRLKVIATASSGTDHINQELLLEKNIVLMDAKGTNATAVVDYVSASLAWLAKFRDIYPDKIGIIGLGFVGRLLEDQLCFNKRSVVGYDPLRALADHNLSLADFESLYDCQVICIHANYHQIPPFPSANLIGACQLKRFKPGTVIINAARGGIVDENAWLQTTTVDYCTDVYCHEPFINRKVIDKTLLCTPHIAGHSIEAKTHALVLLSHKLHDFFKLPKPEALPFVPENYQPFDIYNQLETILDLYNPAKETYALKQATHVSDTFQLLRNNHRFRHHFSLNLP